jgi:predicted MPP superfamily phosphohydrolase
MATTNRPPVLLVLFACFVLSLAGSLYGYVGTRIGTGLGGAIGQGIQWGLALHFLLLPMTFVASRYGGHSRRAVRLHWVAYVGLGAVWLLTVGFLLRDGAWWILAVVAPGRDWMEWESVSTVGVLIGVGVSLVRGIFNARRVPGVKRVHVALPGLHSDLEGFRIVQLSDLHAGLTIGADRIEKVVERANSLAPDLVAVTGDLADGTVEELRGLVAPLGRLRAAEGVFFITGNHEYYYGAEDWCAEVGRLGLEVLTAEHRVLARGEGRMVLAGVPDHESERFVPHHRCDPARALEGAPMDCPRILLAHQPRTAEAARAAGFHLQLSGHTHGGQIFPFHLLVPLQQPFRAGLGRLGDLQVYVSCGTGYWGPPIRLGAPAEITEIVLSSAP